MVHSYKFCVDHVGEMGFVEAVKEFLVEASGLPGAYVGEGVSFETGEHGRIMSIDRNCVKILVLSRNLILPKTRVARTGLSLTVSVGEGVLGRTINTLGYSLEERRERSDDAEKRVVESDPYGIDKRKKITGFFETGVPIVDLVIPIGLGQRELVIGDRKVGKTTFLIQTMVSQAKMGRVCIYAGIGKRKIDIKSVEEFLKKEKIFDQCVIVASDSFTSPGEIFLCPYTAMTVAEYFRDKGMNVLLILDDLSTHAKYYREISLLSGAFPGRESYPGDIFHIHSKILERAGCFNIDGKESSITCLPVAESSFGDITGYIQTNIMSMTDGHVYFDSNLFYQGKRPAINIFLSVTRVGRQTQTPLMRDIGSRVLTLLKRVDELERFLKFGPELSDEIKTTVTIGESLKSFFTQTSFVPTPINLQMILVSLIWSGFWEGKNPEKVVLNYCNNPSFKMEVDEICGKAKNLEELNEVVKGEKEVLERMIL